MSQPLKYLSFDWPTQDFGATESALEAIRCSKTGAWDLVLLIVRGNVKILIMNMKDSSCTRTENLLLYQTHQRE